MNKIKRTTRSQIPRVFRNDVSRTKTLAYIVSKSVIT